MSVLNLRQLSAQIRSVRGNSIKLREQIQEVLISCAYHAMKDGQTTPFNDLLDAVGNTAKAENIALWAKKHGCVQIKQDRFTINKDARSKVQVSSEEDFEPYEAEMRADTPWYDMTPNSPEPKPFDLAKYLEAVKKHLVKNHAEALVQVLDTALADYQKVQALSSLQHEAEIAETEAETA